LLIFRFERRIWCGGEFLVTRAWYDNCTLKLILTISQALGFKARHIKVYIYILYQGVQANSWFNEDKKKRYHGYGEMRKRGRGGRHMNIIFSRPLVLENSSTLGRGMEVWGHSYR
jgi:hypothetical protein